MPIRTDAEVAASDNAWCHLCSNEDGSMKSYDDVLAGMTQFIVKSQGLDEAVACALAAEMMSSLSAWENHEEET